MRDDGKTDEKAFTEVDESRSPYLLEKALNQKEKEWIAGNKKFLGILGHDIKSPMSSIISFLNLLKNGVHEFDRSKIESHIDIALQASKATYILLDNLLEWALAENLEKSFNPEIFDLSEIIADEIKNLEIFTSSKQIEIYVQNPSNTFVLADKKMVKSILRNLLTNAIKYSHRLGRILITTKRKKKFLEIAIRDFGIGINSDDISKIFNSTNYISTVGNLNEAGTGFGLLLCKELIDIHKCSLWILSASGKGSVFKFTLPLPIE